MQVPARARGPEAIPRPMKEQKLFISRQTLQRLGRAAGIFLKSPSGGRAKLLVAVLLALMLGINGMNVVNSYVGRYFMSAIEMRDMPAFIRYAWYYAAVFGASTLVSVYLRFCEERLALLWRDWVTHRIVGQYVDQRIYLHMEETGSITNPDQRIAEDVKQLTVTTVSLMLMILNGTITAISFSGVLWSISPTLFVVAVTYAAAGTGFTVLFGRSLIRLNYRQADYEADFRSELIRVRNNAEGIAVTGNEHRARARLVTRLESLVENFRRIIAVNRNVNFFTTGYNYMIQLIPILIVAPLFINRGVEFGIIGQSAMAFATLMGAFSLIVTQFQSISFYASVVARLSELTEAADKAMVRDAASCIGCASNSDHFAYENLTLRAADGDGRVLVRSLNVVFAPGKRVLVTGPNQAAKQALFRASAGLYDMGSGNIQRPPPDKVEFLPEQPYLPDSTLRELFASDDEKNPNSDEKILAVLEEVGLGPAIAKHDGLESPRVWHDLFSFGEQHLAAIARALLAAPSYVFLDRLGSAFTEEEHERLLQLMANRGITCISFGDGRPDRACHDACLELREDGSWNWREF